ncbi:MAG TPA: 2-phosphosulfolactate phosphatase [Verrucomicrobiae bacterium]|jgi:2-phosphosulfolactate phosphatase
MKIETILSPAELPALAQRDLSATACVVFDILRATSTFVTALQNGAQAVIPVSEISEASALRQRRPDLLLAGERDGVKIRAAQSGGLDFDFGNSPREFIPEKIGGKTIASTTTNGTRALRACAGAKSVLAASFLNLAVTADFLRRKHFTAVLLICAGTGEGVALEDVLAAGALVKILAAGADVPAVVSDATETARRTFLSAEADLPAVFSRSQNARRLLAIPELHADVAFCLQRDISDVVAELDADGALRSRKP